MEAEFLRAIHEFPENTKVPLFRLKIDHSDYPVIAPTKITSKYNETQIANIGKCLQFRRRKALNDKGAGQE